MDIQATAQLLGTFGEFFGAIAVVVTLAYLAGQLRQNTKALRSSSYHHWNEISSSWSDFFAEYAEELTEIEKHISPDDLSDAQGKVFGAFMTRTVNQAQTAYLQHRAGALDDDVFEKRMNSFMTFLNSCEIYQQGWRFAANTQCVDDFVDHIEHHCPELKSI